MHNSTSEEEELCPPFPVGLHVKGLSCLIVIIHESSDHHHHQQQQQQQQQLMATLARRIDFLFHCGALVSVICSSLPSVLQVLLSQKKFQWIPRDYQQGDSTSHRLVFCTEDSNQVESDAHAVGALYCCLQRRRRSSSSSGGCGQDFSLGQIARRAHLTVSLHCDNDKDTHLESRVRDEVAQLLEGQESLQDQRLQELEGKIKEVSSSEGETAAAEFIASIKADANKLDNLRTPTGIDNAITEYQSRTTTTTTATTGHTPGTVYFVGSGPGDPELLTLKAARLIAEADDLVVDALVPTEIYATRAKGRIIGVGKRSGEARVTQEETNETLVRLAMAGSKVVRLKGGDPGVFGRLDEERMALKKAGIRYEIVPGVTSAISSAYGADFSVTSRGIADRVLIMSGHLGNDSVDTVPELPPFNPSQTLAILMGLGNSQSLVTRMMALGYPSDLPVAIVSNYSQLNEKTMRCTLSELAILGATKPSPIQSPATIYIGYVCNTNTNEGK